MTEQLDPTSVSDTVDSVRAALVVAVSEYADTTLQRLRSPAGDAGEFGEVLGDPDLGGFEVTTVLDGRAHEIRLAVEEFLAARRPHDLALVYLSCHGLVDARRRLYFAAADTLGARLASTGVEARWLLDQLEECRARRQVVILDCCFSGAFANAAKGRTDLDLGDQLLGQGRGRVVLTASRATEYSFEGTPTGDAASPGSVFTAALAGGIRTGAADADHDGYISVDDAYAHAFDEMRAAGAQQTPQRWLYGAEGDIVLARNPKAGLATEPIPMRRPASAPHAEGLSSRGGRGVGGSGAPTAEARAARWRPRRRHWLYAGLTAAALLVVTIIGLGALRGGSSASFSFDGQTVVAPASWRLIVSDDASGPDPGCAVTIKNQDGRVVDVTDTTYRKNIIWQQIRTGTFQLQASAEGCLVDAREGTGDATYPVSIPAGEGDSIGWNPSGWIEVTADDRSRVPCTVELVNAENAGITSKTLESPQDKQLLNPGNTSSVFLHLPDRRCFVTARDHDG